MTEFVHIILNLIEAFIFPFFIANYFSFSNRKRYITVVFIIQFIILNIFHFFFTNSLSLTLMIILSMILSIYIKTHTITFNNVFIIILFDCLICLAALSVLLIDNTLSFIFHLWFQTNTDFFLISCLISRFLLVIISCLILKKKLNLSVSFDYKYWGYVIVLESLLLASIGLITYSLTVNEINKSLFITILIFLIIISVLVLLNLYHQNELNKINISIEKHKQAESFNLQKMNTIKNIKFEIDAINHRMFYIYYNIELLLKNKKYDDAYHLLQSHRRYAAKYEMIIDTKNIIFDCLMSLKMNDLISNEVDINLCIFISRSKFYDSLIFINSLTMLIDCLPKSKTLTINISEKNNYTIIKMYSSNNEDEFNKTSALKAINNLSEKYKVSYKIGRKYIKNSIMLSIKREKIYEI